MTSSSGNRMDAVSIREKIVSFFVTVLILECFMYCAGILLVISLSSFFAFKIMNCSLKTILYFLKMFLDIFHLFLVYTRYY